jgi:hypothetical protein
VGIEMQLRPDGIAREVVGVSQEAMDLFSERSRTITKAMAPAVAPRRSGWGAKLNKLELHRLAQDANLRTRKGKEGMSRLGTD